MRTPGTITTMRPAMCSTRRRGAPPGTRLSRPDNMGLQSLEIGGPHNPEIRPSAESLQKVLVCDVRAAGCDRKIMANLARRAYRRPVTPAEVDELMAQVS